MTTLKPFSAALVRATRTGDVWCWEPGRSWVLGMRASVLLWQLGHEGTMWRENVARDVEFCMWKTCRVKGGVWSLSLNWNLTGCQVSVSALMIPCLGGDTGELLPTLSLEYIYLATAAIQTTSLVQLAMGGKSCEVAPCRMRMWTMSRLKSMELKSCAHVTVYFFLEASVKLAVCHWTRFCWNTVCHQK